MPRYATVAGPLISTCPSSGRQTIPSAPPSTVTVPRRSASPRRIRVHPGRARAGAAGQRQPRPTLPHAQPHPVAAIHLREPDVGALREQPARVPNAARRARWERRPRRARRRSRAGCPSTPRRDPTPALPRGPGAACRPGRPAGCRAQSSRGGPMSTRTSPPQTSLGRSPATVRIVCSLRPFSSASSIATHRVALPHAPASPPSGLRMRMKASAPLPGAAASMEINWSQPMPRRRSAMAAARAGVRPNCSRRSSSTTKSLPQPCILTNATSMRRLYGRNPPAQRPAAAILPRVLRCRAGFATHPPRLRAGPVGHARPRRMRSAACGMNASSHSRRCKCPR